jgi:MFS family permease
LTRCSTSTSFQLLYGRLSDIWSRKVVLLAGLVIFFVGSLAASLAQTAAQLIAFRAITGVGGGGLMTVAQTIVSDVVPLRERGKYQGILVGSAPSPYTSSASSRIPPTPTRLTHLAIVFCPIRPVTASSCWPHFLGLRFKNGINVYAPPHKEAVMVVLTVVLT